MEQTERPVVLVVEDEPAVADSFELLLGDDYDVRVALDGESALDALSDEVDVVLLDRMMPGMSGDEVLEELRERGVDCRVAMVTAVDPDFDIIEMGFDDYVSKPPTKEGLRETVEELLSRDEYTGAVRRYRSLLSKRSALQTEKSESELEASDEYAALHDEIEELEADLKEPRERLLDDAEFVGALRDLTGNESEGGQR